MEPLTIVLWKWDDGVHTKKGIKFSAEHINRFKSMLDRNTTVPYRLLCITDDPTGIDPGIDTYPMWDDYKELGGCYRRLKCFDPAMKDVLGPRFLWMDIDCVITANIDHILSNESDFIMWGDTHSRTYYNGSMLMMDTGAYPEVWETFKADPNKMQRTGRNFGFVGTDQAVISAVLGPHKPKWSKADGVYSFRCHFERLGRTELPTNACIVMFHGRHDPSMTMIQNRYNWVGRNWR